MLDFYTARRHGTDLSISTSFMDEVKADGKGGGKGDDRKAASSLALTFN